MSTDTSAVFQADDAVIASQGLLHGPVEDPVAVPVVVAGSQRGLAALAQPARCAPRAASDQPEQDCLEHAPAAQPVSVVASG